jgi:exodeoxyribonuclease VII small subunit
MAKKNPNSPPTFEQLFTELETTLQALEAGNISLDEALALYERGMALAKECVEMLDRAELRIQELAPGPNEIEADEEIELLDEEEEE